MTPSEQVSKAICLTKLARRFDAGEALSTRCVAEEFGVSMRSAQRWLDDLSAYIVPLVFEGGKWRRFEA